MRRNDMSKTTSTAASTWHTGATGAVLHVVRRATRVEAFGMALACAVWTCITLVSAAAWASVGASEARTPSAQDEEADVSWQEDGGTAPMAGADVAAPIANAPGYLSGPPPDAASTSGVPADGQRSYLDGKDDARSEGSSDERAVDAAPSSPESHSAAEASQHPPKNVLRHEAESSFAPALVPDHRTLLELTMMTEHANAVQARRQSRFLVATGVAALAASVGLLYLGGRVEAKHGGDGGELVKMGVGSLAASLSVFSASAVTFRHRQQSRRRYREAAQKHEALLRGAQTDGVSPVGPYFGVTGEGVGVSF